MCTNFRGIMNRSTAIPNQYEGGGTKTVSMFSKLVSQGSSFVMEGVKNLVVKRHVSQYRSPCTLMSMYTFIFLVIRIFPLPKSQNN